MIAGRSLALRATDSLGDSRLSRWPGGQRATFARLRSAEVRLLVLRGGVICCGLGKLPQEASSFKSTFVISRDIASSVCESLGRRTASQVMVCGFFPFEERWPNMVLWRQRHLMLTTRRIKTLRRCTARSCWASTPPRSPSRFP